MFSLFSLFSKKTLIQAALFQNAPVYVQFYVTARCNLTCKQCNVIYSNAAMRECTLDEIKCIADNLKIIGVDIVLLTGGEPFLRKDLPEIVEIFEVRGIHVRMQTNGFASEEQIHKVVEYGGKDISISLDSLKPNIQDGINGGFNNSWHKTLKTISIFTKYLPKKGSFASLGCVLQKSNLLDIEDVIEFGTAIKWFTSLVPIHITDNANPMGFRTTDQSLVFNKSDCEVIDSVVEKVRDMRNHGFLLYGSDQYLDDIKLFIRSHSTTWRDKNRGVCDSPNLYFNILPNGSFAPCVDYRLSSQLYVYDKNFPNIYHSNGFRSQIKSIVKSCGGCMYGCYSEVTISMRFMKAKLQRIQQFFVSPPEKTNWPISYEELLNIISEINAKRK